MSLPVSQKFSRIVVIVLLLAFGDIASAGEKVRYLFVKNNNRAVLGVWVEGQFQGWLKGGETGCALPEGYYDKDDVAAGGWTPTDGPVTVTGVYYTYLNKENIPYSKGSIQVSAPEGAGGQAYVWFSGNDDPGDPPSELEMENAIKLFPAFRRKIPPLSNVLRPSGVEKAKKRTKRTQESDGASEANEAQDTKVPKWEKGFEIMRAQSRYPVEITLNTRRNSISVYSQKGLTATLVITAFDVDTREIYKATRVIVAPDSELAPEREVARLAKPGSNIRLLEARVTELRFTSP